MPSSPGLEIKKDEPLKPYTTFKIGGPAQFFAEVRNQEEIRRAYAFWQEQSIGRPPFVLGGGSNILVSDGGYDGLVIHMARRGINVAEENAGAATLSIAAGEKWDDVVAYAVARGWWGIENLSHIPGQAGAALVQNIGAYGQQVSNALHSAEVFDLREQTVKTLSAPECEFGYRRSIFNTTRKSEFVILALALRLNPQGKRDLSYPDVQSYFEERGIGRPSLLQIRTAITEIRDRKFPYPQEERGGNAGSFFKNLVLTSAEYQALAARIQVEFGEEAAKRLRGVKRGGAHARQIRVPTAFLIELCGLKGWQEREARVNPTQPLVLLNMGGASASDVLRLAKHVRRTIHHWTGMQIALEPELVGFNQDELDEFLSLED